MSRREGHDEKRRVVQERDRLGFALVGMLRVVRESSLQDVLFPGRDASTKANRTWELSRNVWPVGPYWEIHRRATEDGDTERYLQLTEAGYAQATQVLGDERFARAPTRALRPTHVRHDLDLADFMLKLLPSKKGSHQPKVNGEASGDPVAIQNVELPRNWRFRHVSVFDRIQIVDGKTDFLGRPVEKPQVVFNCEPDMLLETDTFNETRYFIEWDRGTEPIVSQRELRSVEDKFRRFGQLVWCPWKDEAARPMWHQRNSFYLRIFGGDRVRRPKLVIITTSERRAENIRRVGAKWFSGVIHHVPLDDFLDVLTPSQALEKFIPVVRTAEQQGRARERPWDVEARTRAAAHALAEEKAAKAKAAADAKAKADAKAAAERKAREAAAVGPATVAPPGAGQRLPTKAASGAPPGGQPPGAAKAAPPARIQGLVDMNGTEEYFDALHKYLTTPEEKGILAKLFGRPREVKGL